MSLNPNLQSKSCLRRYFRRFSQPKVGYCLLTKKCFFSFLRVFNPLTPPQKISLLKTISIRFLRLTDGKKMKIMRVAIVKKMIVKILIL